LTGDAEILGFFGDGYPTSIYRAYVRARPESRWWRFDHGAGPSDVDPVKAQAELPVQARVSVVWTSLSRLADYQHHPDKAAVVLLMARAAELRKR
jgi:hypothetical protein